MIKKPNIVIAQIDFMLCDVQHNVAQIIQYAEQARDELQADLIVFPELSITGYLPEDRLMRHDLAEEVQAGLNILQKKLHGIDVLVGYPEHTDEVVYNSACVIRDNKILINYRKQFRPNYRVFDEKRFFSRGDQHAVFECAGMKIGLVICEDAWHPEPVAQAKSAGAETIISINASPFSHQKLQRRIDVMRERTQESGLPIVYAHWCAGQDDIVFDGGSFALDGNGELIMQAPCFEGGLYPCHPALDAGSPVQPRHPALDAGSPSNTAVIDGDPGSEAGMTEALTYQALKLGVKAYVEKNNFPGILLGLSGGMDSALVLTIAVDALGADRVEAVMMPSRYTRDISREDAEQLAKNLGVKTHSIDIEAPYQAFLTTLEPTLGTLDSNVTAQNLQARTRGMLLMAMSNQTGKIVLTTGNKSELAMGYATLYGDMAGAYAVLKDVYKTQVYALANYRNQISAVIPERIITRPPSAELAPDQIDEDSLPPYDMLDQVLAMYIEKDLGAKEIIKKGFDAEMVIRILKTVDRNEYKRYQAPPGIRVTNRSFGKDRRYPLTKRILHCHPALDAGSPSNTTELTGDSGSRPE
ncbi:MAG: NAD+ synthase [marine bacterium B5-7]|nr:MAG: NAD+ synthase [marine bacterium B5-7]